MVPGTKDGNGDTAYMHTGIPGLDTVLQGGFTPGGTFLIEGESGAGKTMLALGFAIEGANHGESVVYISLSETVRDLMVIAENNGWNIDRLHILEAPKGEGGKYTLFHPAEVELDETLNRFKAQIAAAKPSRVVIDSLAEIRLMTQSSLRYRRELAALKQFLASFECTALLLNESGDEAPPRTIMDGVLSLEHLPRDYGGDRRRLRVVKVRGRPYRGGFHDFTIRTGGLQVFPRVIAVEHAMYGTPEVLPSGIPELDEVFGEGITASASTLVLGAAGTGKSSICMLYANSAAERGQGACIYLFDERPEVVLHRADGLGMRLRQHVVDNRVVIRQVDPAELSPGEFANTIAEDIESHSAVVVVIDSLNGYFLSMPDEQFLMAHMHELLTYLGRLGVSTFLVVGQSGVLGEGATPASASYLTDNLLALRQFEFRGEIRRCLAAVKKRGGEHEHTVREYSLGPNGIRVGEPLRDFQGVMGGLPEYLGLPDTLMERQSGRDEQK